MDLEPHGSPAFPADTISRTPDIEGAHPKMALTYQFLQAWLTSKVDSERGANLIEYALLVALIAVVCAAAVSTLGGVTGDKFSEVGSGFDAGA